jgi:hypothetical protein
MILGLCSILCALGILLEDLGFLGTDFLGNNTKSSSSDVVFDESSLSDVFSKLASSDTVPVEFSLSDDLIRFCALLEIFFGIERESSLSDDSIDFRVLLGLLFVIDRFRLPVIVDSPAPEPAALL